MRKYRNVLKAVEDTGVKAWLVGDSARMIAMGIQPELMTLAIDTKDLDRVATAIKNSAVDARGTFPVLRGEVNGIPFRGFSLQGDTIEEDLTRRDITIEAIALRSDGGVIDPFEGRRDIRNGVIRLTGDDIGLIHKDPLRIVRMLRFAAEFGMNIFWKSDADVRNFLKDHSDRMGAVPAERWGREIISGMTARPRRFISLCDSYNLLPFFLKDLDDLKHVPDGKEGGRTLFDHVMETLDVIEARLPTHKIMQSEAFILAGLFSRIGMKDLRERDIEKADRIITDSLRKWNIPTETVDEVIAIIGNYFFFYKQRDEEKICESVLQYGQPALDVGMEFAACIALTEGLPYMETLSDNQWRMNQVKRRFNAVALQTDGSTRLISGDEIIKLLRVAPGRIIGELLKGLDMAVGTGKVTSRPQAEEWVVRHASSV